MSRSVTFNGITRYRPGAITRVNADALNQIGVTSSGSLGLVGEADGGAPGSEAGLVSLRDPARAVDLFRSGPLVDAIKLAFQSSGDPIIPGGAAEVVVFKTNASTRSSVQLPSNSVSVVSTTASGGSTTTSVNVAATLTAGALVGRWVEIGIAALPSGPTFLRRITANTASAITVAPALPSAPASSDTVEVRATLLTVNSRDYGLHTTGVDVTVDYNPSDASYQVVTNFEGVQQLSPTLGGQLRNYLHVVYRGGSVADTSTVVAGSTTSVVNVTAASLVSAAHANQTFILRDSSGNLKAISKITSNTAGAITLAVALSEAPIVGDLVEIRSVTEAVGQFNGASGRATSFATTITGVTGDNLNIAIPATMTLRQLVAAINANVNYLATVPSNINQDTTLASEFDFGASTSINMQRSFAGTVSTLGFRQDVQEVVDWINEEAQYITAVRGAADALDGGDGNTADYPDTTGDALPWAFQLQGGARGVSSNASFQAGFDAMLLRVVDEVVPLIDQDLVNEGFGSTATWAAVSAQLRDHVTSARGVVGRPRGAFIGRRGNKSQVIAAANGLNDFDIQLVSQNPTIVSATGDLVEKGPREFAVMGASMRLGVPEVGEPLTNKFLRVSGLTQDASWDPADATDAADLILAGVLFAETIPGQGSRWVRDLTTWVRSDNLAFAEGSVRDVVRFVEYGLRTEIQNRFTGRKAVPATIASVKDTVVAIMETYRTNNIIVDSTDPATGTTIRAYHNLKVFSEGDIVRINVGIFPVVGINFQLIDLYLSLPTQAA
ncbi:hypothetical protein HC928_00390 [bacterium]|nr:hypothetical protein [bacterium]